MKSAISNRRQRQGACGGTGLGPGMRASAKPLCGYLKSQPGAGPVLQHPGQPVPLRLSPHALLQPSTSCASLSAHCIGAQELVGPCRTSLSPLTLCPETHGSSMVGTSEVIRPNLPPPPRSASKPLPNGRRTWLSGEGSLPGKFPCAAP